MFKGDEKLTMPVLYIFFFCLQRNLPSGDTDLAVCCAQLPGFQDITAISYTGKPVLPLRERKKMGQAKSCIEIILQLTPP